jgi:predicted DNA-binding ribbon-helix-helix protein
MDLVRIGEKIIHRERLFELVDKILQLRAKGATQQDVANSLDLERPFISNLERLGEIRSGKRIALVGFSIQNREEVSTIAHDHGVDFTYLITKQELLATVDTKSRMYAFHKILDMLARLKDFDLLVFLGPLEESKLLEKVLSVEIFTSPVQALPDGSFFINPRELNLALERLIPQNENNPPIPPLVKGGEEGFSDERGKRTERNSKRKFRIFKKGSRSTGKSSRRRV